MTQHKNFFLIWYLHCYSEAAGEAAGLDTFFLYQVWLRYRNIGAPCGTTWLSAILET